MECLISSFHNLHKVYFDSTVFLIPLQTSLNSKLNEFNYYQFNIMLISICPTSALLHLNSLILFIKGTLNQHRPMNSDALWPSCRKVGNPWWSDHGTSDSIRIHGLLLLGYNLAVHGLRMNGEQRLWKKFQLVHKHQQFFRSNRTVPIVHENQWFFWPNGHFKSHPYEP